MDRSFLRLGRSFFEHFLWEEERPFSRAEAWLDCVQRAAFKPYRKLMGGEVVSVPVGGWVVTERYLTLRWGWSRTKVHAFLELLEQEGMIAQKKTASYLLISLCNFEHFNPQKSHEKAGERPAESRERAHIEEDKEEEEISLPDLQLPALSEVEAAAERHGIEKIVARTFFHSRNKRPRTRSGRWTDKNGLEVADWESDLQGFALSWIQNLRPGPEGGGRGKKRVAMDRNVSRFGI